MIPDGIEPIVAWRYWRLEPDFKLSALNQRQHGPWMPNEPYRAACSVGPYRVALGRSVRAVVQASNLPSPEDSFEIEEAPSPHENGCACGIYAAKSLRELREIVNAAQVDVVGEVYLWGKVIPGERGYRAEYAYPKSLYLLGDEVAAEAGLLAYGVPVGRIEREDAEPLLVAGMRAVGTAFVNISVSVSDFSRALQKVAHAAAEAEARRERLQEIATTAYSLPEPEPPTKRKRKSPWYRRFDKRPRK